MQSYKKKVALIAAIFAVAVMTTTVSFRGQGHTDINANNSEGTDEIQLPVADFTAPAPTDPDAKARRNAKGERYNNKGSQPIRDAGSPYERTWTGHWRQGLPAIPVDQSSLVLVGEVTDARAYLSNDQTGVYSEFTIRIEDILKSDRADSVAAGNTIAIERWGERYDSLQVAFRNIELQIRVCLALAVDTHSS